MSEKHEPAWSDQADAVYVSTVAAIDEMKGGYGERANLLLNLVRYVISTEVAETIMRETKTAAHVTFVEVGVHRGDATPGGRIRVRASSHAQANGGDRPC